MSKNKHIYDFENYINEAQLPFDEGMLKSKDEIEEWLQKYNDSIDGKFTINDDLTVDVEGDVTLGGCDLTSIPVQFGKVTGCFEIYANDLKNLKGSPRYVGEYLDCGFNENMVSFEGSPEKIEEDFDFSGNSINSFNHAPQYVGGSWIGKNNKFTNLKGFPQNVVKGSLDLRKNKLASLEESPDVVKGDFIITNTKLKNLIGGPQKVYGSYLWQKNYSEVHSEDERKKLNIELKGGPLYVGKDFICTKTNIVSIVDFPQEGAIEGNINISYNLLTKLENINLDAVLGNFDCSHNKLKTLLGSPNIIEGDFNCVSNKLNILYGGPSVVKGDYEAFDNNIAFVFTGAKVEGEKHILQRWQTQEDDKLNAQEKGEALMDFYLQNKNEINISEYYNWILQEDNTEINKFFVQIATQKGIDFKEDEKLNVASDATKHSDSGLFG